MGVIKPAIINTRIWISGVLDIVEEYFVSGREPRQESIAYYRQLCAKRERRLERLQQAAPALHHISPPIMLR